MKLYFLILIIFFSKQTQASVIESDFEILSKEFIAFIIPHAKPAIPEYVKTIKLHTDRLDFGAFASEPMAVYLGLIQSKPMTIDSVALVLCHEIGHDFKIAEYYLPVNLKYAFSHLVQDYYASRVCLPAFLKSSPIFSMRDLTKIELEEIPLALQNKCESSYDDESDIQICYRIVHASIQSVNALYEDVFQDRYIKLNIPAPSVNREWLGTQDVLQARLITFINGAFHELPFNRKI